jgi:2'-5' RNA ligase
MRSFFAILADEPLKKLAMAIIAELNTRPNGSAIAWQSREKLHLTLQFLGDISSVQVSDLCQNLSQAIADFAGFGLSVDKLVLFPHPAKPSVIALQFKPEPKLEYLAKAIAELAKRAGISLSERSFKPHLTLGRIKAQRYPPFNDIIIPASLSLPVQQIVLLQSHIAASGMNYVLLNQQQLAYAMTNHLSQETSPYLLQHVNNPVDWYPWNQQALNNAKQEDKPILLSIGYTACHWCHVMAHESFEDEETAVLMNRLFVNIKVDREERPDLDKIYQMAHQLLAQRSGGWPLTVFLNPHDLTPFYTGTYFPREPRYGMPAFKQVLCSVADFYHSKAEVLAQQNHSLRLALNQLGQTSANVTELTPAILQQACYELRQQFDPIHGGFGMAPKFPQPSYLLFLLNQALDAEKSDQAVIKLTLTSMAQGGIYDQLGGGFFRYSVDERWEIPHFEKMLYDNAQLLGLYALGYKLIGEAQYLPIVQETAAWLISAMQSPQGGFYASLDADSEGIEGKYYRWSKSELSALLTVEEYQLAERYFNLHQAPNFEGYWHLNIARELDQPSDLPLAAIKQKLAIARSQRIPPLRDEKILTAWNGLAIANMAQAAICLDEEAYTLAAQRAVDFIRQHLWQNGRLLATYKDGQAKYNAYLDDYAFLLHGLLVLLQAKWRSADLDFAIDLAEALLTWFADEQQGGFFFTSHDHEALIQRPKPFFDEAIPAGNSVAALALTQLGYLLGEMRYLEAAQQTLAAGSYYLQQAPHGCASLLLVLQDMLQPPTMVVLRGQTANLVAWQKLASQTYHPRRLCFAIPEQEIKLPPKLEEMPNIADVTAYICQGQQCLAPIIDMQAFAKLKY